jgi:hypothetical protein
VGTRVFSAATNPTATMPTDADADPDFPAVDPPTRDDLFASDDRTLASALSDVDDVDLAAELVALADGLTLDAALDRSLGSHPGPRRHRPGANRRPVARERRADPSRTGSGTG